MSSSHSAPQTTTQQYSAATLKRAAWAVAAIFAFNGLLVAAWAARIPAMKIALQLRPGTVGLLLACSTVGSIAGLLTAGKLTRFISNQQIITAGFFIWAFGAIILGLGTDILYSPIIVGIGLLLCGVGIGTNDVTMNVEAARVEHLSGSALMPRFHAAFSAGTVITMFLATLIVYLEIPVWMNMVALGFIMPPIGILALRSFLPDDKETKRRQNVEKKQKNQRSAWLEPRTLALGFMVLMFSVGEGTANDWIPVAILEGHEVPQWISVGILDLFLIAMTVMRFFGTNLIDRFGRVAVLRGCALIAVAGSLLLILGPVWAAPIAAILWGCGIALGFPIGMSAAADDPVHAAARVSVVGTIAYTAFLAGPPLIGFVGNHYGVMHALLITTGMLVLAQLFIAAAKPLGSANSTPAE